MGNGRQPDTRIAAAILVNIEFDLNFLQIKHKNSLLSAITIPIIDK
jgi:DNA polymerase III alpha subunit (gram-positive type)